MKADDLKLNELLELDPEGGVIRFAGQRAVLLDAVAMGLLRKYLVENFGITAARTVLTQFGFAHGWRVAEAVQSEFDWETKDDWRRAGTRLHTLVGLFRSRSPCPDPLADGGATVDASYEAEQHLLHLGKADDPVCWTICGLVSGYLSRTVGEEVYVIEDRCTGRGDAICHLVARNRSGWDAAHSADLVFFKTGRLAECLEVSLQRVVESLKLAERKLRERRRALVRVVPDLENPMGIVSRSPGMRQVVSLARRVGRVDSTVLITGESGAGKERIAHLVHNESTRSAGPFIAVNCGAIAETLLESELFGHARGAFTGATADRAGLFEAANGGTLLLDEVGEVSPAMQVKLLRALQEHEVRRVGENRSRRFDVRIIAATNRDLAQGVAGGAFRQDLYYRLKVVELHVPALRDRRDDILPLARVFLAEAALSMKRQISSFSPATADLLLRYDWPGNVRELENVMNRGVALSMGDRIEVEDLPSELRNSTNPVVATAGAVRPLEEVERDYILSALRVNEGNQTRTAEQLGIGTATLYRKLKSYGHIAGRRAAAE